MKETTESLSKLFVDRNFYKKYFRQSQEKILALLSDEITELEDAAKEFIKEFKPEFFLYKNKSINLHYEYNDKLNSAIFVDSFNKLFHSWNIKERFEKVDELKSYSVAVVLEYPRRIHWEVGFMPSVDDIDHKKETGAIVFFTDLAKDEMPVL